MEKLIFRADGNSKTGLGHLYRVFALIEMYQDTFECLLLTRSNSTFEVIPENYKRLIIPDTIRLEDEANWIKTQALSNDCWFIADGYHFDSNYQKKIKEAGFHLVYIDDFCKEHMYADVVVNHAIAITSADYQAEAYTRFALGAKYAILRPSFLAAASGKRQFTKTGQAFVCFGGADPLDLSYKAVQALLRIPAIKKINVVTGAAYAHQELTRLATTNPNLFVYRNLSEKDLLNLMQECDLAIAPASNILYELFAVKMPVLSGYYVDNQKKLYEGCLNMGLIFDGGNFENYKVNDFETNIQAMLHSNKSEELMKAQAAVFDGNSKQRFINLLKTLRFRKAVATDIMQVFEWSNDKLSRANSYFSEPIKFETHEKWFNTKLSDPASLIFIAEINDQPAGMVRYSIEEKNAVVGILIAEAFRGKGLATDFLTETARLYFKENELPVFAYIKVQNEASIRSFEKAGYKKLREEEVHGVKSVVYKLEKR